MKRILATLLLSLVATTAQAEELLFSVGGLYLGGPTELQFTTTGHSGFIDTGVEDNGGVNVVIPYETSPPYNDVVSHFMMDVENNGDIYMNATGDDPELFAEGGVDYDYVPSTITHIDITVTLWVDYPGPNDLYIVYVDFYGDES